MLHGCQGNLLPISLAHLNRCTWSRQDLRVPDARFTRHPSRIEYWPTNQSRHLLYRACRTESDPIEDEDVSKQHFNDRTGELRDAQVDRVVPRVHFYL